MNATGIRDLTTRRFGPGGGVYDIITRAADTGNAHFALIATEPPGGGPPLHTHATEDEFFLILDGEMSFWIDGTISRVGVNGTAFVPRGLPHCFKNRSNRSARALVLFTPGHIEGFFDYGEAIDGRAPSDDVLIARIGQLGPKFGLTLLGPSPL
jgi:mannose-6-phosphate isomerase-like protein (cupin superfamily)